MCVCVAIRQPLAQMVELIKSQFELNCVQTIQLDRVQLCVQMRQSHRGMFAISFNLTQAAPIELLN